jgi:hypothetical protein
LIVKSSASFLVNKSANSKEKLTAWWRVGTSVDCPALHAFPSTHCTHRKESRLEKKKKSTLFYIPLNTKIRVFWDVRPRRRENKYSQTFRRYKAPPKFGEYITLDTTSYCRKLESSSTPLCQVRISSSTPQPVR